MKRKNYICIGLCTFSLAFLLCNCADMEFAKDSSQGQHENFSLLEAKEFFEKQTLKFSASTRSAEKSYNSRLSPGDFVPDWTKTVASSQKHIVSYDIPIESEYQCKAIYTDYKNGKATANFVNVYQKLVIVKDMKTNRLGQYILTLIPDGKYEKRYKNRICDKFINAGDKSDFTGIAIYTIPNLNSIIRVNHYTNGIKDRGVFLSGNREQVIKKISIALSILKGITLKRKAVSATRSYGEDDWMDDWWDSGGSIEKDGDDWIFKDENGNSFIMEDFDGDGVPDTIVVTPDDWDPFPDPDSFPYPDDNPDDDVRCSFCGSSWCAGECQIVDDNNGNQSSDTDNRLTDVLNRTGPILKGLGINIGEYKIRISKEICVTTARTLSDNTIELCQQYFEYTTNDQTSILWHEIYHINHNHSQPPSFTGESIILPEPPVDILIGLETYINWQFRNVESAQLESMKDDELIHMLTEYNIKNEQWYKNEVQTYGAELTNGIAKSDYYEGLVDFMLWKYEQLEQISKK